MKAVPLALICWCLPALLLADEDVERSLVAAKAINAFAAAHHRLQPPGNALTSPLSIEMNLAMVYAGADGKTRDAMAKAFAFPAEEPALHAGFQSLRKSLLVKPAGGEIRVANRVFYEKTVKVQADWLDLTRERYAAEAGPLDFLTQSASAGETIDHWVSEQTAGKIPGIIPAGALRESTRFVLVNAVYFDLRWEERFTKELTQPKPFHQSAARRTKAPMYSAKTVPLMFKQHRLGYARKDGFQIVALPYAEGAYQFVIMVPDAWDGLAKVEKAITGELLTECAGLKAKEVRLSLPRLRITPPIVSLKESLTKLGAGSMFGGSADFSRIAPDLAVSDVFHRTYLELDEEGTKAAAATGTPVFLLSNGHPSEVPHETVTADRPFIYMIQHVPSGACLFLGRLTDPDPDAPWQPFNPPKPAGTPKKK